jgi:hypothetical protein
MSRVKYIENKNNAVIYLSTSGAAQSFVTARQNHSITRHVQIPSATNHSG